MKTLIALDSDGTCDIGNPPGPVSMDLILRMWKKRDQFRFVRVGNVQLEGWGIRGPTDFLGRPIPGISVGKSNLLARWKKDSADAGFDRYIVVDDNPAQYHHGWKGWEFYLPHEFVAVFKNE